ncbi:MAG: histidine kinase dimerization/phospho-acceptor domain-containing protein [Leptolyngbya sp.]|nr:histidine kinase dimerization/phospho-acceptor domain-containing protein [Leptolyngbya sp.]
MSLSSPLPWPPPTPPPSDHPTAGIWPWLVSMPSYVPTTPLQRVAADLGRAKPETIPWPSHIIVVDDQQRPQGTLAMGLLWARQQGHLGDAPAVTLQDCWPWLEPIVILDVDTDPSELEPPGVADGYWVGVDGNGQYRGVIDGVALMAEGRLTATLPSLGNAMATVSRQEQQWVIAIGHALKTPLTSLLGLSTLMLDHRVGSLNDRQARYAALIRRSVRKLIRLVNQLLDWMRLEAGQIDFDPTWVDLQGLTETLLPTFLTSCLPDVVAPPPWMATFRCYRPDTLPLLRADRLRLRQSLHGVLGYCLHRGSQPQSLTLESWGSWFGLTLRATPGDMDDPTSTPWAIPVGLEADNLETLSLTLARRLCQQQGGDLVGFCSPRDGYHITLLLPRSQGDTEPDAEPDAEPNAPPSPRGPEYLVLLVSTSGEQVGQAQAILHDQGMRLLVATRWQGAVDLVQRLTPDLVLLDQGAPVDWPINPLAILAQMVPRPGSLVMIHGADSLALALASCSDDPQETTASPLPQPWSGLDVPTLLILAYQGQLPPARPPAAWNETWTSALQHQRCRLVQADDLVQARLLCRVWQPQAIVLAGTGDLSAEDWAWVAQCPELMQRPWLALSAWAGPIPQGLVVLDGSGLVNQPPTLTLASLIQTIQSAQR